MKRERTQIGNEIGHDTINTTDIQEIIQGSCVQFYAQKIDNLEEVYKFLETYKLPRLIYE